MKTHDALSITGTIKADIFDTSSSSAQALEREIQHHITARALIDPTSYHMTYREMVRDLGRFKVREHVGHNLIATVGRQALAKRLGNDTTYTGIINYGALGSSSTAAANADTQLGTEVFRKTTASTSNTTNQAFIDFFYSKADTNGTYQEFGTFIDGTGSANSGQLFSHFITGGWTKTSSESMTVAVIYTLS
jgi:hypothetical protein